MDKQLPVIYNDPYISEYFRILYKEHKENKINETKELFDYISNMEKKIDYMSLAKGFGAKAFKCQNQQELKEALKAALKEDSCVWIECAVDKEEKVLPMNSAEF